MATFPPAASFPAFFLFIISRLAAGVRKQQNHHGYLRQGEIQQAVGVGEGPGRSILPVGRERGEIVQ